VVEELVSTVLERGNGTTAQRQIHRGSGQLTDIVAHAVKATAL
jgi:hypothetical protein